MKIAVLTNDYPPDMQGGAGAIALKQVEGLRDKGHEVHVWYERAAWLRQPMFLRLIHHVLDVFPRPAIVKEVVAFKPDLLLTHNLTGLGFGTPQTIQKEIACAWFHVLHDVQLFEPSGSLREATEMSVWQKGWSMWRERFFGQPSMILSPTQWLAEAHQRRGWFKDVLIKILPNPGPVQEFALRHPHEPMRLLFLGGRSRAKGYQLVERLAQHLGYQYEVHIAGDNLSGAKAGTVFYHGRLQPQEVHELMQNMDILLVPSQVVENQPTVILEAASVGLPVIAADIGGIKETLGRAGILCPLNDLDAWVRAIERYLDSYFYQNQATMMFELATRYNPKRHIDRLNYFCEEKRKTST